MEKNVPTRKLIAVVIGGLIIGIITNVAHPITPAYINYLEIDSFYFGLFLAAMNAGMFLFSPFWGSVGDIRGRKKILICSFFCYAIGQVLFGTLVIPQLIIVVRFISGIFIGAMYVCILSYLSNSEVLESIRKKVIGLYVSFNIIGASLGSALGGIIGYYLPNLSYCFYIQAILIILAALYFIFFLDFSDEKKPDIRSKNPFYSLKDLKKINLWHLLILIMIFISSMAFANVTKFSDRFFTDNNKTTIEIGLFNLVIGFITLLMNLFITPLLQRRHKNITMCIYLLLVGFIAIGSMYFLPNPFYGFYTIFLLYIAAKAAFEPTSVNFLCESNKISNGVLLGVRQSFIALGGILGVFIYDFVYGYAKNAYFLLSSCLLAICFVLTIGLLFLKKEKVDG